MSILHFANHGQGKHWSAEKIANTFAPSKHTADQVESWLLNFGISPDRLSFSKGRNWIQFDATVAEAEALLQTEYHAYEHSEGGYRVACDEYHVPEGLSQHIDFIMPTLQLEGLKPMRVGKSQNFVSAAPLPHNLTGTEHCNELITIECMRALYQFPAGNSSTPGNEVGIGEWADFLYLPDLDIFYKNYTTPEIPAGTRPQFLSIDGGQTANATYNNRTFSGLESCLDFDTMYSIVYPQKIRLYQMGDGVNVDSVGTFNIFLDALDESYCTYLGGDWPYIDPAYPDPNEGGYTGPLQCGGAPNSSVYSFSYNQIEAALPVAYQTRQCNEWMKIALQGSSVLFASGDSGVANRYNSGYNNSCLLEEGPYVSQDGTRFSPSFPCNCPWVTSGKLPTLLFLCSFVYPSYCTTWHDIDTLPVGATDLLGGRNGSITSGEMAVADPDTSNAKLDFYSGGAFSNVFEMPSYQSEAVSGYLKNYTPPYNASVYNNSGVARAYPDVSALGLNLVSVWLGELFPDGGTSASTPLVAGIITLLNEARAQVGKKPIGFLNAIFYAHPEMFNDVTVGSNPGCGTDGFKTAPGWDPVTGLGTPNYPKMKEVFLSLP